MSPETVLEQVHMTGVQIFSYEHITAPVKTSCKGLLVQG